MLEQIVIGVVLVLAALLVSRSLYKAIKGKGSGCGCGKAACPLSDPCDQGEVSRQYQADQTTPPPKQ